MTLVADFNTSVSVPFQRMRQLLEDAAVQAGVVGATDLKVAQRGAGANMSVDVPAGQAYVEITTGTRNGLGHVTSDATANLAVTASHATLPRIDQVVLQWNETSIPTGSGDVPTLSVLAGTATSGATLDNRTGAAALGNDRLRLADILVPAASTSVTTANIRDRRPWARGARWSYTKTSGAPTPAATPTLIDSTNMQPRIECSGAEMLVTLTFQYSAPATGNRLVDGYVLVDGSIVLQRESVCATNAALTMTFADPYTPTAGSHVFGFAQRQISADGTISATATTPITATITEIIKPNASNS